MFLCTRATEASTSAPEPWPGITLKPSATATAGLFLAILVSGWMPGCDPQPAFAEYRKEMESDYAAVCITEAGGEGLSGMVAVAEVLRNRGWDLRGFSGLRRVDRESFLQRQPARIIREARRAVEESLNGSNTVFGATHFENVEAFGVPSWARNMRVVKRVGRHSFFAEKRQGN